MRPGRQILSIAIALAAAALAALLIAASAGARTIDVKPRGPSSNVLQKAINRAEGGDRIRVHQGRYRESISVGKRVEIFAARGERRPVIDARCRSSVVIDVLRSGVSLRGLKVVGAGDAFTVNFVNIDRARVDDLRIDNTCGDALYGVNVYGRGAIKITDSRATGFLDAGFYVGSIATTGDGALVIKDSIATGNNRGAIVEDSFGVDIRILDNVFNRNTIDGLGIPSGIFVHNTDGALIAGNRTDSNGVYGIHLDAESDDNVINGNVAADNGDSQLFDEGTGNCGLGNSFPISSC